MQRVLITGITGFVGGHLAEALLAAGGVELVGLSRAGWAAEWSHLAGRIPVHEADIADGSRVEAVLREFNPRQIFHLAGYAHTGKSFQEPDQAWHGNLTATRSLFEAVARWGG